MQRMTPGISGSTRIVGVIGWPVRHSLSPAIHNAAFRALELDWAYVPLPVRPGRVAEALAGLSALGVAGANVTMPHKTDVARAVDERSADAALLDAVNTIVVHEEALTGHNTDAPGFERFLVEDLGTDPRGRRALVYGAGGAARACVLALGRLGAASVTVVVREAVRAAAVRIVAEATEVETFSVVAFDDVATLEADLLVNATPLGSRGEALPVPALGRETVGIDLLYRPATTPLQDAVRAAGGLASGGLGLLLHQAARSFELWTGQPAPLSVMSAAALAVVAEPSASSDTTSEASPADGGHRSTDSGV
jgi:shikimate dehydrogenase